MIRKIILILLSLIMTFAFAGCQLAVESKGTETNTDALCGMFITFKSLHSEEDYFDNIDWSAALSGGKQMYQAEKKPIYATEKVNPEFGDKEYYFEGIEGIRMMEVLVPADGEQESYWNTYSDYKLIDTKTGCGGGGTFPYVNLTLEGTLYVYINPKLYKEDGNCTIYSNPVYQTSDGRIYTVPANYGYSLYTSDDSEYKDDGWEPTNFTIGNLNSHYISCNTTREIDGREESWTSKITLNIIGIYNINKYVFKQMNAQDGVISSLVITESSIPEEIALDNNAAYAILEEHSTDVSGKAVIKRSMIDVETESLDVRFPDEKGFALTHRIPLKLPVKTADTNA